MAEPAWFQEFQDADFTDEQKQVISNMLAESLLAAVNAMRLDVVDYFDASAQEVLENFGVVADADAEA